MFLFPAVSKREQDMIAKKIVGAGRPKVKPLENTLSKRGSRKEETQESLVLG